MGKSNGEPEQVAQTEEKMDWKTVDKLVAEQKMKAALEVVLGIREQAQAADDAKEWARALVEAAKLRVALHGYETAVRDLLDSEWPNDPAQRAILDLYTAQAMVAYLNAYGWEIRQRERVISDEEVDLKRWTEDQIVAAVQRAYGRLWIDRESWGAEPLGEFSRYLYQNNYPPRIRGTLRDAISYLWVELLANTSMWRPEHSAEIYRLDLESLAAGSSGLEDGDLVDTRVHPLTRISAILADLELWHEKSDRVEAALEARLERVAALHGSVSNEDDQKLLRSGLQEHLEGIDPVYEWWAMGQARIAGFLRGESDWDALVSARDVALKGLDRHAEGVAASACRHHIAAIEAPSYSVESMAVDGPGRRSMRVTHRNLDAVYFRAYEVDLAEVVRSAKDYNLLPGYREVPEYLKNSSPVAEWKVELPETPDFRSHATDAVPPISRKGAYLIVSSVRSDFDPSSNRRLGLNFFVSDLVLVKRQVEGAWEISARSGFLGEPLQGVELDLYRADWRRGHQRIDRYRTDESGRATIRLTDRRQRYFLLARNGDDVALIGSMNPVYEHEQGETRTAFIYSDRSVYRPHQQLHWKVLPFAGHLGETDWQTMTKADTIVSLVDANGEEVASETVTTNAFGSASGTFDIPGGRMLGSWSLRCSAGNASTSVRVEEYKRPTFTVEVEDPEEALRLNRMATLRGSVAYYFGLPVAEGELSWRVSREPVYPRWWYWWRPSPATESRIIDSGESDLGTDGNFEIQFLPEADEREAKNGVTYRYRLEVDVTDPGGETRSASRSFRLGFTAVEAAVDLGGGFVPAGRPATVRVVRSDLDGIPRAGEGAWKLMLLDQPEETLTPAQQPLPDPEDGDAFATPDDRVRTRWNPRYEPQQVLSQWSAGRQMGAGELLHGDDGSAALELPRLRPGAYRLVYETVDDFGTPYTNETDFVAGDAKSARLKLPAFLAAEKSSVSVGETARFFVHSGFSGELVVVELFRNGKRFERLELRAGRDRQMLEVPVDEDLRGGFSATLTVLRDHQLVTLRDEVFVPWDDRKLKLEFATFRDRLRPGQSETFRVTVKNADESPVDRETSEVLAYMFDKSLEIFAPHNPPGVDSLYPRLTAGQVPGSILGRAGTVWQDASGFGWVPPMPVLNGDRLRMLDGYGIGGPGGRGHMRMKAGMVREMAMPMAAVSDSAGITAYDPVPEEAKEEQLAFAEAENVEPSETDAGESGSEAELRTDFSETAFFEPHLVADENGEVTIEFETPDSVTEWNLWVHAVTNDLRGASEERQVRTVKELMVRPAVPRFLREGDSASLRVVVNNAGEDTLNGTLRLELVDPDTDEDLRQAFDIDASRADGVDFAVEPGQGTTLEFPLRVPPRPGMVAFRVTATAGDFTDGELRPLPVLPGRMHLLQSRFAALHDADRRELVFADMTADDPSLIHDQLVVSVDAQLFYGVLDALPYLVEYPYECTEQTLNRFLSTGIVTSVFERYPSVAQMAEKLSERDTRLEAWDETDPNRKIALEETPWLQRSRGGEETPDELIKVLDPRIAEAHRRSSLSELEGFQTSLGAFPWWPGGPPSPYMTLYVLAGFAHALEFEVDVPKDVVVKAWAYMHRHYLDHWVDRMLEDDCCWEMITWLNFVLSSYPDESWTGGVFKQEDRARMLDHSFRQWKRHAPRVKSYLAVTLHRMGREDDARLVWDSVMDSAITDRDLGTYWAPEERAWLWYNDTVETHAIALRTLSELDPTDERRLGLVQWIFLNKKLSHWSNTRTTAEVIYSLVHYLEQEDQLGVAEDATVTVGPVRQHFEFDPDEFTGKDARVVVAGEDVQPEKMSTIVVEKQSPGLAFATATWHFSTEKMPEKGDGDLFAVDRFFYRRSLVGDEWVLEPLAEGARIEVGDQIEVELRIRARHAAEFVHLRDPRGAGFEPESLRSGWRWDLGVSAYEEIRDSGSNLFFEWLPVGEYTFKYRVRAAMAGTFKVAPAVMQSMYAPEFGAYSAGHTLEVGE